MIVTRYRKEDKVEREKYVAIDPDIVAIHASGYI